MSGVDIWLLVVAALLVVVAGLFSSADAALSSFSKARAEEIAHEGRAGSTRLLIIVGDPPRYLNTALFLRMLREIAAIVAGHRRHVRPDRAARRGRVRPETASGRWWAILASIGDRCWWSPSW